MDKETKFLIDTLTKNLVLKVINDYGYSVSQAMDTVYSSRLYDKILDTKTGLYYQSSCYNYELLRKELQTGKIA